MIRRSDGAKLTYDMLEARYDELAASAAVMSSRIRELEAALRQADCVRPINSTDDVSVGWCVDNGHCGCGNNRVLTAQETSVQQEPLDAEDKATIARYFVENTCLGCHNMKHLCTCNTSKIGAKHE